MTVTTTATIRVPTTTRDALAEDASRRGLSVSALLTEQAREYARAEWFRAGREASKLDSLNPKAMAEQALWEETDDLDESYDWPEFDD